MLIALCFKQTLGLLLVDSYSSFLLVFIFLSWLSTFPKLEFPKLSVSEMRFLV